MWLGLVLLVLFALARPLEAQPAGSGPVGDGERAAIRAVIELQLDAFRRDDASGAFALASPAIRELFGDEANFMAMVRGGYPAVYRPRDVDFAETRHEEGSERIVQRVRLVGPDGAPVDALYLMRQAPDGRWLIDGCILTKPQDQSA